MALKDGITDENDDFDGLLVLIISTVVLGCILTLKSVFADHTPFDFEKFGTGVATILGAGGMGYGAKRLGEKYGNRSNPSVSQE